jgi:hypothetical protein
MLSRDTGHKRVPAPPQMTTGIKRAPLIVRRLVMIWLLLAYRP